MILSRGELLIAQAGALLLHGENTTAGALFLSNRRIVFEAGAGGPNPYTAYSEGIERVRNVHSGQTSRFLGGKREFLTIESHAGRARKRMENGDGNTCSKQGFLEGLDA
jgi:hypothetical protein